MKSTIPRWMLGNSLITKVNGTLLFFLLIFFYFFFDHQRYTCASCGTCVHAIQLFHVTEPNRTSARMKRWCDRLFFRSFVCYICTKWNIFFFQKMCTFVFVSVKVTQEKRKKNYQRKSKPIQNVWWKSTQLFSTNKKHSDLVKERR